MEKSRPGFHPNTSPGASATALRGGRWQLSIPPGPQGVYRLAQLDDYAGLSRRAFHWHPPFILALRARASATSLPGTWGFGLWNDPFSLSLSLRGGARRFPALPYAAWFFFAGPPNHLSFRDDLPAQGFLAQVFRSKRTPALLLALGVVGLPLLAWPWTARRLRPLIRHLVEEDGAKLKVDVTHWHAYQLAWDEDRVRFTVDGEGVFETNVSPNDPLGLVLWIDNQYAAFPPDGRLAYGTLFSQETNWIEIESIAIGP